MSTASDIIDLLEARANSGGAAFAISDTTFAKIISILQRRFGVGRLDVELMLADVIREHEDALYVALRDHVHLDEAEDAVWICLGEDQ